LVLVRQKLALVGGDLRLVGDPVEEKMPLTARRAKITLSMSVDMQIGYAVVARIQNIGMVPLDITKVFFEYRFPDADEKPPTPSIPTAVGGSFGLTPRERKASGAILPGESRDWVLPLDYYGEAFQEVSTRSEESYKIVAYAGPDPVAEAPGKLVRPYLDPGLERYKSSWGLRMNSHMQNKFLSLEADARNRILDEVKPLQERPTEEWTSIPGVIPVEGDRYFLAVPPDYQVLLRRFRRGPVELLDVLRNPGPLSPVPVGGAAGSEG
jgi:hypothetical protein